MAVLRVTILGDRLPSWLSRQIGQFELSAVNLLFARRDNNSRFVQVVDEELDIWEGARYIFQQGIKQQLYVSVKGAAWMVTLSLSSSAVKSAAPKFAVSSALGAVHGFKYLFAAQS